MGRQILAVHKPRKYVTASADCRMRGLPEVPGRVKKHTSKGWTALNLCLRWLLVRANHPADSQVKVELANRVPFEPALRRLKDKRVDLRVE